VIWQVFQFAALALAAAGGAAGLTSLLKVGPERRKVNAEAFRAGVDSAQVLSTAAVGLLDPYLDQIKFLSTQLTAAREEIVELRAELAAARSEIGTLRPGLAT
jgi:hypothetical protein